MYSFNFYYDQTTNYVFSNFSNFFDKSLTLCIGQTKNCICIPKNVAYLERYLKFKKTFKVEVHGKKLSFFEENVFTCPHLIVHIIEQYTYQINMFRTFKLFDNVDFVLGN